MNPVVIYGASRGLGAALAKHVSAQGLPVVGFARKAERLAALAVDCPGFQGRVCDLASEAGQDEALRWLSTIEQPRKIFCVAGGGPYGPYEQRPFHAHTWAWNLNFLFPARLAHQMMQSPTPCPLILIGSSVAEAHPDPLAASYAAAKHALLGLYGSLRAEAPNWDLRLFSPGYMDTEMLPPAASIRSQGVHPPEVVARELWQWSLTPDVGGHKVMPKHP